MTQLETHTIDVGGRGTAVIAAGSGEPLVFLHGGGIVEGVECFATLAERFRFLAPRMPGFGGTELRPIIGSIDQLVAHTAHSLDVLGAEKVVLVGHSLGGWLAASFAAALPERVRLLVIAAPYGLEVPGHPLANTREMSRDELFAALTRDPGVFAGRLPDGPAPELDAALELEGRAMGGFVPGSFDPALPSKLGRISMPTLLQWGESDRIVPIGHLPAWQAALPHAQTKVYPGVEHLLYWEHRPAVADIATFASG